MSRKIILSALVLSLAVCFGACSRGNKPGAVESGELVVVEDTTDIKLGIYGIDTLNPIATKSKSVQKIMNIVYEPLFRIGEAMEAEAVLASSYTLSEDGMSITVNLKDGVKWHDGTNFTAEDVVYTLSRISSGSGLYSKIADKINSFTATGKSQVVITLRVPETNPAYLLTFPVMSAKAPYLTDMDFVPMGTGSYKFESMGGTEIVLAPNPAWHEDEASKKKISVKILKDTSAVTEAFNVNELDAITSDQMSETSPKTNSRTEEVVSNNMVFLGFNASSPALAPANIRRAIGGFLDRKKILEQGAYGHGMAAALAVNPSSWAYQDTATPELTQDYAESLIVREGYVKEGGVYHKDGAPLSLRLLVNVDNPQRASLADGVADSLSASGVLVAVEKIEYADYVRRIAADDFDIFIGETEVQPNHNPSAMIESQDNYFNFDITELSAQMSRLLGVTDKEIYKAGIGEYMRKFYASPPYIPLYFKAESVIYGEYVSGTQKPTVEDPYNGIEKWYFYDKDGKEKNGDQSDE